MLIDFHSHFFSRPFFEALARLSPQPGSVEEKLAAAAAKAKLELPPARLAEHLARWTADWDRHGLAHVVSFASLPEEVPALAEAAQLAHGRLTPFALVNPLAPEAPAKARALLEQGPFRGLLLFPAMHRFRLDGPELHALLEAVRAARPVVVVHCGMLQVKLRDLLGLPRSYDFRLADPLALAPAANSFHELPFVVPHFGAGLLRETLMLGALCENVHVDSSSSNSWIETQEKRTSLEEVFERALGVFGARRVLFGTDSSTLPRGWRADLYHAQQGALERIGATREVQAAVFGGNAARLLHLRSEQAAPAQP